VDVGIARALVARRGCVCELAVRCPPGAGESSPERGAPAVAMAAGVDSVVAGTAAFVGLSGALSDGAVGWMAGGKGDRGRAAGIGSSVGAAITGGSVLCRKPSQ